MYSHEPSISNIVFLWGITCILAFKVLGIHEKYVILQINDHLKEEHYAGKNICNITEVDLLLPPVGATHDGS